MIRLSQRLQKHWCQHKASRRPRLVRARGDQNCLCWQQHVLRTAFTALVQCWKTCRLGVAHEDSLSFLHWRCFGYPFPSTSQFLRNPFHTGVVFPEENLRWQQHHSFCNGSRSSRNSSLCHQALELVNGGPLLSNIISRSSAYRGVKVFFVADLVMCRSHLEVLHPHFIY